MRKPVSTVTCTDFTCVTNNSEVAKEFTRGEVELNPFKKIKESLKRLKSSKGVMRNKNFNKPKNNYKR